jgi:uncharacterized protein involved in response to NO
MTIPRLRSYAGPALFSMGFRPCLLGGALFSALAIMLWLPVYMGGLVLPSAFPPLAWHVHEMLFGFLPAIVAGFLLTAVPNWTGRKPLQGAPLAALAALWLAGRLAIGLSGASGATLTAVIDCSFLASVTLAVMRKIAKGKNWRNLKVAGLVALLLAGNVLFHIELATRGSFAAAERLGVAALILLIVLIGGRVVPAFTRNWLMQHNPGRLPVPFDRTDAAIVLLTVLALAVWTGAGSSPATAGLFALAGAAQAWRLGRWAGWRAARDTLVLILHLAYAFVPFGFAFMAAAMWRGGAALQSAGLHVWTAGAAGAMTLAIMTRATLGHTGRPLRAGRVAAGI